MTCKNCNKQIREVKPLHFSNQIARKLGYCSFICMSGDLGKEEGFKALQQETKNTPRKGGEKNVFQQGRP